MDFIKDAWYCAGFSGDLGAHTLRPITMLGEALVRGPGFHALWFVTAGLALGACLLGFQTPNQEAARRPERGPLLQREAFGPGFVLLLGMIPFVGFLISIAFLVLLALPGTPGPNRFGPDPKGAGEAETFA